MPPRSLNFPIITLLNVTALNIRVCPAVVVVGNKHPASVAAGRAAAAAAPVAIKKESGAYPNGWSEPHRHYKPEKHAVWTRQPLAAPVDPLTTTLSLLHCVCAYVIT